MEIFQSRQDDWLILEVKGKMDAVTSPAVREKIIALTDTGEKKILFDCSTLEYVSSAGLRVLFEAAYKIQDLSGRIGCYGINANVRKVFNMTDLGSEIPMFNSREDALKK